MHPAGSKEERMKLTKLGGCVDGTCPAIYLSDRGTIVVQGSVVNDSDVIPPDGEALVEIPLALLRETNA